MASTELAANNNAAPAAEPPQATTATVTQYIIAVFAFNDKLKLLWRNPNPIPDGVTPLVMFVDRSGSIKSHVVEMRNVAASFLRGTDAEGKVHIDGVSGQTGMISAIYKATTKYPNVFGQGIFCDWIVIGDGRENMFHGDLAIGVNQDGLPNIVTLDSSDSNGDRYLEAVANHLTHVCGGKMYYLGIGADAERMVNQMVKKRNCYVAHLPKGATTEQTMGIVNALRSEPTRLLRDEEGDGDGGRRVQQDVLRLRLSPEVEAAIAALDDAEVRTVASHAEQIQVTQLALPEPWTTARLKTQIESAEAEVAKKIPRDSLQHSRAALLFGLVAMRTASLPGAMLTGKHCAVLEGDGSPTWGKFLNTMLSQLAPKGTGGVLSKDGTTPDVGAKLPIEDEIVNFPGKCPLYKCNVPIEFLKELAEDQAWCAGQNSLKRKRS